jgi:hypothetical protein
MIEQAFVGRDATTWKIYKEKFDISSEGPSNFPTDGPSLETSNFALYFSGSCRLWSAVNDNRLVLKYSYLQGAINAICVHGACTIVPEVRQYYGLVIDNLHVRLIFDLGKKEVNSRKELVTM